MNSRRDVYKSNITLFIGRREWKIADINCVHSVPAKKICVSALRFTHQMVTCCYEHFGGETTSQIIAPAAASDDLHKPAAIRHRQSSPKLPLHPKFSPADHHLEIQDGSNERTHDRHITG
jgi:hypothetical protein